MSGGKRFKFQGSTIAVSIGFDAVSPSKAITGISKANPAVVTSAGHGFVDGDVVLITGVAGMTEVNAGVYIVDALSSSTFALVDTDSTAWGTYTSGGHADEAQFSNWCELTGYNHQGGTKTENDASSLCSTAKEYELGLADFGTTQFDFHYAPQTSIQLAMAAYNISGDPIACKVTLPKSGGVRTQIGFITQMSETASVNGLWTATMTIRNTGKPFDQAGA